VGGSGRTRAVLAGLLGLHLGILLGLAAEQGAFYLGGTYDDILLRSRARSAHFVVFYPDLLPQVSHDFLTRLSSADLELAHVFPEPSPSAPDQRLEVYRLRPK
jgi:hypothetical protein